MRQAGRAVGGDVHPGVGAYTRTVDSDVDSGDFFVDENFRGLIGTGFDSTVNHVPMRVNVPIRSCVSRFRPCVACTDVSEKTWYARFEWTALAWHALVTEECKSWVARRAVGSGCELRSIQACRAIGCNVESRVVASACRVDGDVHSCRSHVHQHF